MTQLIHQLHRCVATGLLDPSIFATFGTEDSAVQECEILDFKRQLPESDFEYAKTIRDVVALHNSYGGFLVFGIREIEKDRKFEAIGVSEKGINLAKLRDMSHSYLGTDLRLSIRSIPVADKNLEVIWVSKRDYFTPPLKFSKNGPDEKPGKPYFKRGEIVFRRIECNAIAQSPDDYEFLYSARRPPSIELTAEDLTNNDPLEHNLPDRALVCSRFVGRREDLGDLWAWLADDFSRVRLIAGEGGLGKTSLAYQFCEEVASRRVTPFVQVVWLTAKKRQFLPSENLYQENRHIDFRDAKSLFIAIAAAHGCIEKELENVDTRELLQLALQSCSSIPSLIVIDDVDSLSPDDQLRALELGMRTPPKTKMLLTTRVNFSYSPDNVLKLNGLGKDEFREFVQVVREKYGLSSIKSSKIDHLLEVSGGSPLFTDSLLRLERRGVLLDQAIRQWKEEKGLEARKAALQREIQQLSKEAKRTLYVISHIRNASFVELQQILEYTEQTLGDALQELTGLFLVSAPSISREARYTVDTNTGLLVLELGTTLGIDHTALIQATKRASHDAIGISLHKRSSIVGQAIAQATAFIKKGDTKAALDTVVSASKKLSKPNADLLLAIGRFSLKQTPTRNDEASKAFSESYSLGQRKQLLFDLWFETEYSRGSLSSALDVADKAISHQVGDIPKWLEHRAQVHIALAHRAGAESSSDSAIREADSAISNLKKALEQSRGDIQSRRFSQLIDQAENFKRRLKAMN